MILEQVVIHNVRCVVDLTLQLAPSFNLFLGPNGAGKTTILECIHVLARARSFRRGTLNTLITYNRDDLLVSARGVSTPNAVRLGIHKTRNANAQVRMNGKTVRQVSQMASALPIQTFLPDVSELVFGAPALRRSWLNWTVFHVAPRFLALHREFLRALNQRNRALQQQSSDLSVWTQQFVDKSLELSDLRESHLVRLATYFDETLARLMPELKIGLQYYRGWSGDSLLDTLDKEHENQVKYGVTRSGPHRADIRISVVDKATGKSLGLASQILSRGQGKIVACAMKLAQTIDFKQGNAHAVILIDDLVSEFDTNTARQFLAEVERTGLQVIANSTQITPAIDDLLTTKTTDLKRFEIQDGTLTAEH